MALKLIAMLTILVLATFLYNVWDKTNVPEEIPDEDVWKVKTIQFSCRLFDSLGHILVYFGVQPQPSVRTFMSYSVYLESLGGQSNPSVTITERQMAGVPVLHFKYNKSKAKDSKPQAVIIYIHGGGWELLDARFPSAMLRVLTEKLQIPSLSVDYRLAPEHPYPAALEDCLKVTNYVLKYHKELAVDPNKIIVAGDSAGGNLAAAVALKLKKKIRLQVLIYPALQALDFQTPSYRENADVLKHLLSPQKMIAYVFTYSGLPSAARALMMENRHISEATRASKYSSYVHSDLISNMNITRHTTIHHSSMSYATDSKLVQVIERRVLDPYFSPLMADSLDDVADAYVITAQHDVLRDDGLYYCSRLNNATNVKCDLKNYVNAFHGFMYFAQPPLSLSSTQQGVDDVAKFIAENVL